eukprot:comp21098_c0_seq1/m.28486 comp21098_c0_seq1/g.28486  ORF comp21098_c0_seq1/g.28486 comp21098_c0_seq1/m.28486 type:complete len:198 (-) comp21098_c0_seq1:454-1047(-)
MSHEESNGGKGEVVIPGQRLGHLEDFRSGPGTYVRGSSIHASTVGTLLRVAPTEKELPLLMVVHDKYSGVVPEVGSVVIAKVTGINPRFAKCDIICVGSAPLKNTFRGTVRSRDVRATEKDKVEIHKCFRPGDIIRAEVMSLGDARSYLLMTAKNEYGVVFAESLAGATMVPVSWCEMLCPKTRTKELRKVARPDTM